MVDIPRLINEIEISFDVDTLFTGRLGEVIGRLVSLNRQMPSKLLVKVKHDYDGYDIIIYREELETDREYESRLREIAITEEISKQAEKRLAERVRKMQKYVKLKKELGL